MSEFYNNNNNIYSGNAGEEPKAYTPDNNSGDFQQSDASNVAASESSYEWNSQSAGNAAQTQSGEYHYSYVNGNNSDAAHNPNNYERAANDERESYNPYSSPYNDSSRSYGDAAYNSYSSEPSYTSNANNHANRTRTKKKKEKKPVSRGFVAAALIASIVASAGFGFGGGYLANQLNNQTTTTTSNGGVTINQVTSSNSSTNVSTSMSTTSDIVKKTADSVVEIETESTVRGSFAQQYVQKGAGSGVIISKDGYIITNHHVIDGASNIKVTLRDGTTTYDATLIGSDEDNDIALLKVNAADLSPATFGNSGSLAVGDYVVAIGNPLGELGGTVTDGIISALAREVTIENKNMTLLQTNAQISPGNSGGGLFNANGELIGIVNAKDSATEVEGIAFAIPINNVLDIIKDLQNYGYVTGKIDLGMEFVDINSNDTAFYYGVNKMGCYVLSVDSGSNAESAGFTRGDLIVSVNGTEVSSSTEINKALENNKVGDEVTFTVSRGGRTFDIKLKLGEYVPSVKPNDSDSEYFKQYRDEDIWEQIFGW